MPQPNVLWIMADQLRADALSCYGDPNIHTPHLDRLAAEGVRFTHAYSQYPVCMPFRGGLVTGQYAHINGVRVHGDLLPTDRHTVAHAFRAAGYRTSWVGKWHLASTQGVLGWNAGADYWVHPYLRGGFEDWYGFDCSNHYYRTRYCHGESIWPPLELAGYQTDGLADISLRYLDEEARRLSQPWFHCLSVEAPHPGSDEQDVVRNVAPPQYEARFRPEQLVLRGNVPAATEPKARQQQAGYYAQIANLDDNVGRVLAWLDETGLAASTLVVFFADHGEMGGSQGRFHKEEAYEESIHIPALMRLPGIISPGQVTETLLSGIDLFPTTAGLCGVPIPPEVQGHDLSAAARGMGGPQPDEVLIQWLGAARHGFGRYSFRAIRTPRYTYCVSDDASRCLLYDNAHDPFQQHNLFATAEAQALRAALHQQLKRAVVRSGEALPDFLLARDPA